MVVSTPVAFIIFNRPDLTQIVFEAIRQAQPKKLLVVADGARFPEEIEKCQRARDIIKQVDWDCEVLTNFSRPNMGSKLRVSSGLDWVFSQVEEAIILEDDCLPSPSFFYFCQTLLERYRDDERIMQISGNNLQFGQSKTDYSYDFSKYIPIWGWASWRRAWNHYDVEIKNWEEFKSSKIINSIHTDTYEQNHWLNIFEQLHQGLIDTWDYQWDYACWSQGGLSIVPNTNLVSNIGFRSDGTHTTTKNHLSNLPVADIWEIKHPLFVLSNREADAYIFDHILGGNAMKEANTFSGKLRAKKNNLFQKFKKIIQIYKY